MTLSYQDAMWAEYERNEDIARTRMDRILSRFPNLRERLEIYTNNPYVYFKSTRDGTITKPDQPGIVHLVTLYGSYDKINPEWLWWAFHTDENGWDQQTTYPFLNRNPIPTLPGIVFQDGHLIASPMDRVIAITDLRFDPLLFDLNLIELRHCIDEANRYDS